MSETVLMGERVTYNRSRTFATEAEARAFREGVELVNDSALSVVGIGLRRNRYTVFLWDWDAEGRDDA